MRLSEPPREGQLGVGYAPEHWPSGKRLDLILPMAEGERSGARSAGRLWLSVFAFAVCSLYARLFDLLGTLYLAPLAIPLAAWVGARHGRRGLAVVLLAGLFLIPGLVINRYSGYQPALDIWLVAVAAGLVAAADRPLPRLLPARPFGVTTLGLLVLLPFTFGLFGREMQGWDFGDDLVLTLEIHLHYVFYAGLFAAGLMRVGAWRVALLLAAALLVGVAARDLGAPWTAARLLDADRADLPLLGLVELEHSYVWYAFHTVPSFLAGLAFFVAGRLCGDFMRTGQPPSVVTSFALILGVAVLAAGILPLRSATGLVEQGVGAFLDLFRGEAVAPAGETGAIETSGRWRSPIVFPLRPLIPLLGFAAAFLPGRRGVLPALAALVGFLALESAIRGHWPHLVIPAGDLLVLLGFAALGVGARNRLLGTSSRWWSTSWAVYLTLVVILAIDLGLPPFTVYLPLLVAGAIALGWGAQRLRRWLHGRDLRPSPGWVALFALAGALGLVWSHMGSMWQALVQLATAGGFAAKLTVLEDAWTVVVAALMTLWLLLSALKTFVEHLPAFLADLRRAWQALVAFLRRRPLASPSGVDTGADGSAVATGASAAAPALPWWHPARMLKLLRTVTQWVAVAVVAAGLWRPTAELIEEFIEDRREERASREPLDERLAVERDPELLAAAREMLRPWGIEREEQGAYRTVIETGWHVEPATPDVRRRATVRVGPGHEAADVDARVQMQTKKLGLWTERSSDWEQEKAEAEALEGEILERAAVR
jgi:hypothetical protein